MTLWFYRTEFPSWFPRETRWISWEQIDNGASWGISFWTEEGAQLLASITHGGKCYTALYAYHPEQHERLKAREDPPPLFALIGEEKT